ncbi:hypothetical protein JOL62DRAFT_553099 [Phyllosticta paracitricarpa]|uniref:Uncharacterized protein n=1 Tax=Phyllosticta paracitricarpa TaxID=2016321 RepID=A0ABR1NJF3_9PEZI
MSLTLPPRLPDTSQQPSSSDHQQQQQQPTYQTAIQQFKQLAAAAMDWSKRKYNEAYERWVPWLEDWYLKLFTRDNKASYAAKDHLVQTKISGNEDVDAVQDGANTAVADQLGQDGVARPVGDVVSKEVLNRAERKGRGEDGEYVPQRVDAGVDVGGLSEAVVGDKGKGKGKGWFGRK